MMGVALGTGIAARWRRARASDLSGDGLKKFLEPTMPRRLFPRSAERCSRIQVLEPRPDSGSYLDSELLPGCICGSSCSNNGDVNTTTTGVLGNLRLLSRHRHQSS